MRSFGLQVLVVALLLDGAFCVAEPVVKPAPIVKLSLFKNGAAAVERRVTAPGKEFCLTDNIRPIHGTFWLEPFDGFRVRNTRIRVEEPLPTDDLAAMYQGQTVTVNYGVGSTIVSATGKVLPPVYPEPEGVEFSNVYSSPYGAAGYFPSRPAMMPRLPASPILVLAQEDGSLLQIRSASVVDIRASGAKNTRTVEKPGLLFEARSEAAAAGDLCFGYLARGISWAPAYRVILRDDGELDLRMDCMLTDELEDFSDAEVALISGFPNIAYGNVMAPLARDVTLSSFFQSLNSIDSRENSNAVLSQRAIMSNVAVRPEVTPPEYALTAEPAAGEDVSYYPLGKLSMRRGDTMYLPLESKSCDYDRLVVWNIPDGRDASGRMMSRADAATEAPTLWDSIRFRNPFSFPMTTAPMAVYDGNKFLAQVTSYWTNPGQEAIVPLNKALTIMGSSEECEVIPPPTREAKENGRETVKLGSYSYWRLEIEGRVTLKNYRGVSTRVLVKVGISGEIRSSSDDPKSVVKIRNIYSVNKSNELIWEVELAPGEEKELKYRYSVLVLV